MNVAKTVLEMMQFLLILTLTKVPCLPYFYFKIVNV